MSHVISSARLDLVALPPRLLLLVAAGDADGLARLLGAEVPAGWPAIVPARRRLAQLAVDPGEEPWLARAIVLRSAARTVGYVGFHAAPDPDGRVEIGYQVLPGDRRQGYARESVRAMADWAYAGGAARVCVASVAPHNGPSLGLVRSLGFVRVGEHMDEEDGLEHVYERALPLPEPR